MRAQLALLALILLFCIAAGSNCPMTNPGGNTPAPCTEDASASITVIVEPQSSSTQTSACTGIKPELESRLASVRFMNTHTTRRIALAVVLLVQSDKQSFPLGPCTFAVQRSGAYPTLEACRQTIAEGCNAPVGLFIEPGQTSSPWIYQCKREQLFPGSGSCGDLQLETISTTILAHAVFCDDPDAAQVNFCAIAAPRLLNDGLPVNNNWVAIQSSDCP